MRPILALTLAALGLAGSAAAQDAAEGRLLFTAHCVACHGPQARGTGPMAEILAIPTPDLTGLKARNGGEFPVWRVVSRIDGRDPLLAHGGEMPIFGGFFERDEEVSLKTAGGQPVMTSRPIADIVAFLESVQE
ncbi:cytochrome C [Maritimibacter sp. 55A14]|uniref:c-type cytochrome n=1 Tax=Maritimibacter sp. 55A14 TaxID=2174844 RepID=UPI000D60A70F|nr:cytochrome c [Maritimibacter sp. 55A14]PWE30482.1 cytochrome C [Maritimibacter sp. 55A14]